MTPTQVNTVLGSCLTANVIAKSLYYDQWYQHKRADLNLSRIVLASGEMTGQGLTHLQRSIHRQHLQLTCIKYLARMSFIPLAVLTVAYNFFKK